MFVLLAGMSVPTRRHCWIGIKRPEGSGIVEPVIHDGSVRYQLILPKTTTLAIHHCLPSDSSATTGQKFNELSRRFLSVSPQSNSALTRIDLPAGATEASALTPLSLPVSATVASVLALVVLLALQAVNVVLIRVMAADRQAITRETYTRRMGWVLLNSIVASVVVGLLTAVGFVLLVIPGLFVLVSLLFVAVYIADRDENVLDAIRDS